MTSSSKNMIIIFCNKGREPFNEVCWLSTIYLLSTQRHASDTLNGTMVNGSMLHKWWCVLQLWHYSRFVKYFIKWVPKNIILPLLLLLSTNRYEILSKYGPISTIFNTKYAIETLRLLYNFKTIKAYHRRSKACASFFQELAFLQQNRHFLSNEDRLLASWILVFCLGPLPSKMFSVLDLQIILKKKIHS